MNMFKIKYLHQYLKIRTQLSHFALILLTKFLGITVVTNIDLLPVKVHINLEQNKCVVMYEQANQMHLNLPITLKNINMNVNRKSHELELHRRKTKTTFFNPKNRINKNYTIYIG